MKENLPELKDLIENTSSLSEFGAVLLLLCSIGYTVDDFQAYVDEEMKDPHMQKTIEVLAPLMEVGLEAYNKEKQKNEK